MDLVKMIMDHLSGETLDKLSSLAGTDTETTETAVGAAVPAILSGLAGMAAKDDGARKLVSTLNSLESSGLGSVGNVAKMLGGDSGSLLSKWSGLLSSLLGENVESSIASAVGRFAGLDLAATKKILASLLPMILGVVGGQWKGLGGSLGALTNLFADQRKNIASAVPSGFSLANIPGLPSAEGALRVAGQSARAAESAGQSMLKWLAPLAAVLLLGLGLWYFLGRGREAPKLAKEALKVEDEHTVLKPTLPEVPALPDIRSITKDLSGIFDSAKQTLGNISDAASAQAALPQLKELDGKIDGIRNFLDKLPAAGQAALGQLVSKQFAPLKQEAAKVLEMPDVSDEVKSTLTGITHKFAGLNLGQVSKDATAVVTKISETLKGFKDAASAEAALPQLEEISGQLDELKQVQVHMSPGGQTMLAKIVSAARGSLDQLITKVLTQFGVEAAAIKPALDGILNKLASLTETTDPKQPAVQ